MGRGRQNVHCARALPWVQWQFAASPVKPFPPHDGFARQGKPLDSQNWSDPELIAAFYSEVTPGSFACLLREKTDRLLHLKANESCHNPPGERHRVANPGQATLRLVEVQYGSHLGDDDIVRFDDDYGRA